MDEFTAETFANREDPLPVVDDDDESSTTGSKSTFRSLNDALSANSSEAKSPTSPRSKDLASSLQDRLFTKLLQQIAPSGDLDQEDDPADERSTRSINRPGFSLPIMTSNFRRFNARIGVVFVFQARLLRLLSWRSPTKTLSLLAVYTFVCVNPYLLAVLPIATTLLFVMVPSFIARHPPAPTALPTDKYSVNGPPIAPPPVVKPVSEMSKDFFRNLRDLQNSMDDFANVHDRIVNLIAPSTNFSDETLSSFLFLALFALACSMFLAAHLLPWRAIFLVVGWVVICCGHPSIQTVVISTREDHLRPQERKAEHWLSTWMESDIMLDSAPEVREVEVFELQRRNNSSEWEGWVFSPLPYDPMSSLRVSGERPPGTRFFEDVQPPPGWKWADKKWTLDLLSREWVEERMITAVEVEMEGERWVYDIQYDDDGEDGGVTRSRSGRGKLKKARPDQEEGSGLGKTGRWRRRRWSRLVQRKVVRGRASGKG